MSGRQQNRVQKRQCLQKTADKCCLQWCTAIRGQQYLRIKRQSLIKKPASEYEDEVRFFMVPKNNASNGSSKKKFVDVKWEDIINEVRIDKSCTDGEKLVVKQFCGSKGIKFTENQKAPMKNNNMMEIYMEDFDINSMEGPYPITIE